MKITKAILLLTGLTILFLTACKKEEDASPVETLGVQILLTTSNGDLIYADSADNWCDDHILSNTRYGAGSSGQSSQFYAYTGYSFDRAGAMLDLKTFLIADLPAGPYDYSSRQSFPDFLNGELENGEMYQEFTFSYSGKTYSNMLANLFTRDITYLDDNRQDILDLELVTDTTCYNDVQSLLKVEYDYQGYVYDRFNLTDSMYINANLSYLTFR